MTEKSSDALPGDAEADPVLVAIGDRLRQARLQYGARLKPSQVVSQVAIARIVGVTGVTVGAWEAGKNDAGVPMLYKLAELYGVSRVWLLTGVGDMYDGDQDNPGGNVPVAPTPRPTITTATADDFTTKRILVEGEPRRGKKTSKPRGHSAMAG